MIIPSLISPISFSSINLRANSIDAKRRFFVSHFRGGYFVIGFLLPVALLIFDIKREKWDLIDELDLGYIYDIEFYNDNLYLATYNGVSIITVLGNKIINDKKFDTISNYVIKEINFIDDKIYFLSDIGLRFLKYSIYGAD